MASVERAVDRHRNRLAWSLIAGGVAFAAAIPLTETGVLGSQTEIPADSNDAATPIVEIDDETSKVVEELAATALPASVRVQSISAEPSIGEDGALAGAFVELKIAPFSGTLEFPAVEIYESESTGKRYEVPELAQFDVEGLTSVWVAVDLASERVLWASPNYLELGEGAATLTGSRSTPGRVDVHGVELPPDAKIIEGE